MYAKGYIGYLIAWECCSPVLSASMHPAYDRIPEHVQSRSHLPVATAIVRISHHVYTRSASVASSGKLQPSLPQRPSDLLRDWIRSEGPVTCTSFVAGSPKVALRSGATCDCRSTRFFCLGIRLFLRVEFQRTSSPKPSSPRVPHLISSCLYHRHR